MTLNLSFTFSLNKLRQVINDGKEVIFSTHIFLFPRYFVDVADSLAKDSWECLDKPFALAFLVQRMPHHKHYELWCFADWYGSAEANEGWQKEVAKQILTEWEDNLLPLIPEQEEYNYIIDWGCICPADGLDFGLAVGTQGLYTLGRWKRLKGRLHHEWEFDRPLKFSNFSSLPDSELPDLK